MKMVILRGLPGSGKSHWARAQPSARIVSADHYFEREGVYNFNPRDLGKAHAACFRRAVELCALVDGGEKTVVIIDNTNTTAVEMAPYIALANAFEIECSIAHFNTPIETCLTRQTHGVPEATMRAMDKRLVEHLPAFFPPVCFIASV